MATFAAMALAASLFLPAFSQAASLLEDQRAEMVRLGDHYEVQNLFFPNAPSREGMIRISATARQLRAAGYTLRLDKADMPPVFIGRDGRVHEVGGPVWDGVLTKTWLLHRDKARKFRSDVMTKMRRVASQADLGNGPAPESAGDDGRPNLSGRNAKEMARLRATMAHSEKANVRESAEPASENSVPQPRPTNASPSSSGQPPATHAAESGAASQSMEHAPAGLDSSSGQGSVPRVKPSASASIPNPVLEHGETSGGSSSGRFGWDVLKSHGTRRWWWLLLFAVLLILLGRTLRRS